MKELGYGNQYKYSHDYEGHFADQEFMPEGMSGMCFYEPQNNGKEREIKKYIESCWKDKYKNDE